MVSAMGDCELCGKMSVSTMKVTYHKSVIESCTQCSQKMNLIPVGARNRSNNTPVNLGKNKPYSSKKNLLNSKSLIENFSKRISAKRAEKKWSKAELAKIAKVRLVDIQNIEAGKILEDKVVQRIEKALGIELFTEDSPLDVRRVKKSGGSGMTLGDFLNNGG